MHTRLATHPLAEVFRRLTPDQVLDAVEVCGRRCTGRFFALNSYENRVYQFEMEDGSAIVGKFYRPGRWSREAILEEHAFLAELSEAEIPVACPIELETGETLGEVRGIYYALFPHVRGRVPQELTGEQLPVLGRLLARIHNVGELREARHRLRLTPETYGEANLEFLLSERLLPEEVRENYAFSVRTLLERIGPFFQDVPMHRIHGDCHLGNLVWTSGGPTFSTSTTR